MTPDFASHLRLNLEISGWNAIDLWLESFANGGDLSQRQVSDVLSGALVPSGHDFDILGTTLNEQLADCGYDHPVRAWSDLPGR